MKKREKVLKKYYSTILIDKKMILINLWVVLKLEVVLVRVIYWKVSNVYFGLIKSMKKVLSNKNAINYEYYSVL